MDAGLTNRSRPSAPMTLIRSDEYSTRARNRRSWRRAWNSSTSAALSRARATCPASVSIAIVGSIASRRAVVTTKAPRNSSRLQRGTSRTWHRWSAARVGETSIGAVSSITAAARPSNMARAVGGSRSVRSTVPTASADR